MNRRALTAEQRLAALVHVDQAIAEVRRCIDVEPTAGPLLVASYRALSVLGELREVVDAMPQVAEESRP
jgi:hypothetical protein